MGYCYYFKSYKFQPVFAFNYCEISFLFVAPFSFSVTKSNFCLIKELRTSLMLSYTARVSVAFVQILRGIFLNRRVTQDKVNSLRALNSVV